MIWTTAVIYCVLGADVPTGSPVSSGTINVIVIPNVVTLKQRDHLRLMCVVENRGKSDLTIRHSPHDSVGDYGQLLVRKGDTWQGLLTMQEQALGGPICGKMVGRALLAGSAYAEFSAVLRHGDSFLFEAPGKYELRAAVRLPDGVLTSRPVTITVESRSPEDQRRIKDAADALPRLDIRDLRWPLPEQLKRLEDVGGNIGRDLRNIKTLQEYASTGTIEGKHVPVDSVCEVLRKRLDPVSWETGMQLVGQHFMNREDRQGMTAVAQALTHDSSRRHAILRHLRFLADPTAPHWSIRRDFGQPGDERVDSD